MVGLGHPGFEAGDATVIWRYMPVARVVEVLAGRLYFAAARQFDDAFEGAITEAAQSRRRAEVARIWGDDAAAQEASLVSLSAAFEDLRRMTKISCWHGSTSENAAMWQRYLPALDGVAVRSTVGALKRSLKAYRLDPTYGEEPIVVGRVRYIDFVNDEMTDRSMLAIFLHKRVEYRDEQEVRALLSLRMAAEWGVPIPEGGVSVQIDPGELIHELRVGRDASDDIVTDLREAAADAGIHTSIARSTLARKPVY